MASSIAIWKAIPVPRLFLEGPFRRDLLEDGTAHMLFDEEHHNVALAAQPQAEKGLLRLQPLAAASRNDGSPGRTAAATGVEDGFRLAGIHERHDERERIV